MIAEIALALVVGAWTLCSPEAMAALGSPETLDTYAREVSKSYYSTYSAPDSVAAAWTNNARIAAICVAGGTTGFLPLYMLYQNAADVGQAGAIIADHDMLGVLLSFISPHSLLELTCIFIIGTTGLKLFWTMLALGRCSRTVALAAEGQVLIMVAAGLTAVLAAVGLIEAFVTPAPIPWLAKIAIGVGALTLLWIYTLILDRFAVVAGSMGDLEEDETGYVQPEAG